MTACDLLPSIDTFTNSFSAQQTFFNLIRDGINELCTLRPITVRKVTRPAQEDFHTAWLAADPGNTLPIPTTQEFIWFDTAKNEIGGIFRTIDDLATNIGMREIFEERADWGSDWRIVGKGLNIYDMMGNMDRTIYNAARRFPNWNDGATAIAFQTTEYGTSPRFQLAKINDDATGLTRLTNNAWSDECPSWVGSNIAFMTTEFGAKYQISTITDAGAGRTRLTNNADEDRYPAYSPDGAKIAFLSDRGGGLYRLWIMNANGTGQTLLSSTTLPVTSDPYFYAPSWSPDGAWIYWWHYRILPTGLGQEDWFTTPDELITDEFAEPRSWYADFIQLRSSSWMSGVTYYPSGISISPDGTKVLSMYPRQSQFFKPLIIWSLQVDGELSTGKVYQTSQWIDPFGNFRLLKKFVGDGVTSGIALSSNEIPDGIDHILIVAQVLSTVGNAYLESTLFFNGDATAANYFTERLRGNAAVISKVESAPGAIGGIPIATAGDDGAVYCGGMLLAWVIDIHNTSHLKQVIFENTSLVNVATTFGNYYAHMGVGLWNNTAEISSISLVLPSGVFTPDTIISFYGLPGKARWQE